MSVIIGMDPHKRSGYLELIEERAMVLAAGQVCHGHPWVRPDSRRGP